MNQKIFLLVMVLMVPMLVLLSGAVSLLLLRMGYGVLVWALLPFLGLLFLVAVLGFVLSRLAGKGLRNSGSKSPEKD